MLIPNTFCNAGSHCVSRIFSMYSPPPPFMGVCVSVGLEEAEAFLRLHLLAQASETAQ